jgi:hypothetical protein
MRARLANRFVPALLLAGLAMVQAGSGHADQVTFSFSGRITSVSPTAPGFPAALSGLSVGDPVSYLVTMAVPAAMPGNPFGSPFDTATPYSIADFSFIASVDGVPLVLPTSGSDRLFAFVWDGDFASNDGFTMNNNGVGFLLNTGNLGGLAPATFGDESFPTSTIEGRIVFQASQGFTTPVWFAALGDNLTLVPEPSTYAMVSLGLILVGYAARRRASAA